MLGELGDPRRVGHVALAARDDLDVLGVDQPALDGLLQEVVHRSPVLTGRLHRDQGDLLVDQPLPQAQQ